jgi:hypothetical protein
MLEELAFEPFALLESAHNITYMMTADLKINFITGDL